LKGKDPALRFVARWGGGVLVSAGRNTTKATANGGKKGKRQQSQSTRVKAES